MEIQFAARRVAEENKSLRTLLRAKGVKDEEIHAYLLNSRSPNSFLSATKLLGESKPCFGEWDQPSDVSFVSAVGTPWPLDRRRTGSIEAEDQGTSTSRTVTLLTTHLPEEQIPKQDMLANTSAPGDRSSTHSYVDERGQQIVSMEQVWEEYPTPGTTTSCNLAITIIISMNGDISESQARLDLGCGPLADCNVQNSTLLELLDSYSAAPVYQAISSNRITCLQKSSGCSGSS